MSSICGYWSLNNSLASPSTVDHMLARLNHWEADQQNAWSAPSISLGHLMLYNTPESLSEVLPYRNSTSNCVITADARIDNREELAGKLSLDEKTAREKPDSWYILTAYEKWGEDCTKQLEGDFAFAIWDESKQQFFCARDHIGVKPFYYYYKDGIFAFATEIKGLLAIEGINKSVNKKWIINFLVNFREDRRSSAYQHIHRLEAAHQLCLTKEGIHIKRYWELDLSKKIYFPNEEDYATVFLEKLNQAISKRLRSHWSVTAELSGGLDSSVIIALAQKIVQKKGKELITISDVMPEQAFEKDPTLLDDRESIMILINHLGLKQAHLVSGEEKTLVDSLNRIVKIQDEPTGKTLNIFADLIYEKTSSLNSRVILSGFGGNDFVSQMGYFFHEELFRTGKWKTLWKEINLWCKRNNTSPLRRWLNIIPSSFLSVSSRNYKYYKTKYINRKTYRSIKNRFSTSGIHPELLKEFDLERKSIKIKYANFIGRTMSEKSADRLNDPSIFPDRLEYCNLSTTHNRIEYRYPLLDIHLLEYFLSIPSTERIKNGWSRYLYRKAGEGLVPPKLLWEKSQSSSPTPSFLWRMYRDKQLMFDALEALPKESDIHQFMDVKTFMEEQRKNISKKHFSSYRSCRLFLLHHFLNRSQQ